MPTLEGQVLLTTDAGGSAGGLVRGIAPADLRARAIIAGNIRAGSLVPSTATTPSSSAPCWRGGSM